MSIFSPIDHQLITEYVAHVSSLQPFSSKRFGGFEGFVKISKFIALQLLATCHVSKLVAD